jgi:hypothetical protein
VHPLWSSVGCMYNHEVLVLENMFNIGQSIVCVSLPGHGDGVILPEVGKTYTVRGFFRTGNSIVLEEIYNEPQHFKEGFYEAHFLCWHFRPVVKPQVKKKTETGMKILKKTLKTVKIDDKELV